MVTERVFETAIAQKLRRVFTRTHRLCLAAQWSSPPARVMILAARSGRRMNCARTVSTTWPNRGRLVGPVHTPLKGCKASPGRAKSDRTASVPTSASSVVAACPGREGGAPSKSST